MKSLPVLSFAWLCLGALSLAEPVVRWDFGQEETTKLIEHGGVHRDLPGPRPPEFPDFEPDNLAVQFDGSGAHYVYAVRDASSPMSFTNGDAITIEAWVNMTQTGKGENTYVIGKGRTEDPAFSRDNQNWALRMREEGGRAHLSFLFATPPGVKGQGARDAHYHRWTSGPGFVANSGWHHVAVTYRFGEPESIRGYLDGQTVAGAWDMGGATQEAPVVDADAVWVGSSMGGKPASSFRGMLDSLAIHREALPEEVLRGRFRRSESETPAPTVQVPPPGPKFDAPPAGKVLVTFHEALAVADRWPKEGETVPPESSRWVTDQFLVPRMPLRYDDWGIRTGWKGPALLRASAEVQLPPGKQRFLLRVRGLSRLWVNDAVVATAKPPTGNTGGYQPVRAIPEPPAPGLRPLNYGDQEIYGETTIGADGRCRIVLETVLGSKRTRPDPGELCLAIQTTTGSYALLGASGPGDLLTDAAWTAQARTAEATLAQLDETTRRAAAASQDAFWDKRHQAARAWVAAHPAPSVPAGKTAHPIDAFLAARIDGAVAASAGAVTPEGKLFHEKVLPVLSDQCFRCHGEKEKGDLRLNSREAALKGGTSGLAAIVPGEPGHSELLARLRSHDPEERMPPKGDGLSPEQIAAVEAWIKAGAPWPAVPVTTAEVTPPPAVSEPAFLRRVYLDTVGVPPTDAEAGAYLAETGPDRRARLIDRLLADPRLADHWISYWQDVLAENPNILKPSLNNSGPFRWFLYDAMRDGKAMDRTITELIMLRGSIPDGGSAGFGLAADNDAPFAAKGQILGSAFLGVEMQCARCHDAPFHSSKQRDLYALAAMLDRKPATVPKSSTVPAAFFEKKARESLIKVTLKPGEPVPPAWPFAKTCGVADGAELDALMQKPADSRERLAALITAPQNTRVAQVLVNRVWKSLLGAGLVEPAHDWEGHPPSHPEMLEWLGRDFVAHDYDFRHLLRMVLTSEVYAREATGQNLKASPERRFFAAPDRRRLTAEEVVDTLYAGAGKGIEVEELTFDPDTRQSASEFISLGRPSRAWMFASLSNERDRPSLALPRAQAVTDVLEAFGWAGSRQNPRTDRETDPNVLQPGVLANSTLSTWVIRVTPGSALAQAAAEARSPEDLVKRIFLRFLTRPPTARELGAFSQALAAGFQERLSTGAPPPAPLPRLSRISWSNHLMPEATEVKAEMEKRARAGEAPDTQFSPAWRETYEDFVWAVINTPEFVWMP